MKSLNNFKSILKFLGLAGITIKLLHLYAKQFPTQIIKRNDINYAVDLNQLIDFGTFIGGWEPSTINFLEKSLSYGDVVIEVGANVGAHTLIIGKLIGNTGHVYAFEPTEFALNKLRKNLSLNPAITNVTIRTELVSNIEKSIPKLDIRSSWPVKSEIKPGLTTLQTPKVISIDDFSLEIGLDNLALIKVDVDGYDYKVLQGAKTSILRFRPLIFCELCEYALNEQGDSVKNILEMLLSLEYEAYLENGTKVTDAQNIINLIGDSSSVNCVFVHKTKIKNCKWVDKF